MQSRNIGKRFFESNDFLQTAFEEVIKPMKMKSFDLKNIEEQIDVQFEQAEKNKNQ